MKTETLSEAASFYAAKVAFEIPASYLVETHYGIMELPDSLCGALLKLCESGSSIESQDICSPTILILHMDDLPSREWVEEMQARINAVLQGSR